MDKSRFFYTNLLIEGEEKPFSHPTLKVLCVGRNYVQHAKELNNPVPDIPVFFAKSMCSLQHLGSGGQLRVPERFGVCHFELEVALLLARRCAPMGEIDFEKDIAGIGLALDLTRREVQDTLKAKGQPWERAKNFVGSCPVTVFIPWSELKVESLAHIEFRLIKNGTLVQHGRCADMIFSPQQLLTDLAYWLPAEAGDVLLTGTPAGVGPLENGDRLELWLMDHCLARTEVIRD